MTFTTLKNGPIEDINSFSLHQETLSPEETNVTLTCTASPSSHGDSDDQLDPSCTGLVGRHQSRIYEAKVESTGAVVIAVVSAGLLLTAVAVLIFLHRNGKLEHYL